MTFEEELVKAENEYIAAIGNYLKQRAKTDPSVERNLKKENKSLERCFRYIIDEARKLKKGNCAMVKDEIVYGWAVHYYDEDEIDAKQQNNVKADIKAKAKMNDTESITSSDKQIEKTAVQTHEVVKNVVEEQLSLF